MPGTETPTESTETPTESTDAPTESTDGAAPPTHRYQADVRQILELVTHSLYSDREIFLRELVSNASDALDRARFERLSDDSLRTASPPEGQEPGIRISVDSDARQIIIEDDGIGLTAEEAELNLGTIAHSGTSAFRKMLDARQKASAAEADKNGPAGGSTGGSSEGLIGQFGVGFYSAFMVADRVTVDSLSGHADASPIHWESEGGDGYALTQGDRQTRGTRVVLHVRDDAMDYLELDSLRSIIQKYSDFIPWPVMIGDERANQEQALWRRDPTEVSDEDYKALYRHLGTDWQEPLGWVHARIEGKVNFDTILFLPASRPWTMDRLDFKPALKLYQKRVKVLDSADQLLPRYLRWVTGVVDSSDIDLNMSREILQQTPALRIIKKQLTKRVLERLKDLTTDDAEAYAKFWDQLGHILKEGIHEATQDGGGKDKDRLVPLLRFKTTTSHELTDPVDRWRSLAQVKADMVEGQDAIWYLTEVDKDRIAHSPLLEAFKKRGIEVLLLDDPVDEWVTMNLSDFEELPLKSVAHGDLDELDNKKDEDEDPIAKAAKEQAGPLATFMEGLLGDDVAGVRLSTRLVDSPSVLVNQDGAMSANMERILKAANQDVPTSKRVLEINPEHPMVKTLAHLNKEGKTGLEPFARLLLDHAAIAEGRLEDAEGFAKRLQALMEKAASAL